MKAGEVLCPTVLPCGPYLRSIFANFCRRESFFFLFLVLNMSLNTSHVFYHEPGARVGDEAHASR